MSNNQKNIINLQRLKNLEKKEKKKIENFLPKIKKEEQNQFEKENKLKIQNQLEKQNHFEINEKILNQCKILIKLNEKKQENFLNQIIKKSGTKTQKLNQELNQIANEFLILNNNFAKENEELEKKINKKIEEIQTQKKEIQKKIQKQNLNQKESTFENQQELENLINISKRPKIEYLKNKKQQIQNKFQNSTQKKKENFEKKKFLDQKNSQISQQNQQLIQDLNQQIEENKRKLKNIKMEFCEKNSLLKKEKEFLIEKFLEEKKKMEQFREDQFSRLSRFVSKSNQSLEFLRNLLEKGKNIEKLWKLCFELENEDDNLIENEIQIENQIENFEKENVDKIVEFSNSNSNQNLQDQVKSNFKEKNLYIYNSWQRIQKFNQKMGKIQLETFALQIEKENIKKLIEMRQKEKEKEKENYLILNEKV
ncbi:dynein regulatory complex subunit 2 [Anaeramoeba ignava]|uniref:Dynein regulatory complex subunit 2 n=1 Tax=Anaeramoeba ignava TaxID=1746090 RepID=A0A9Q0LRB3_ANAIG|nr:dynein regulatory complex subunit 2 [Anaeramoeba ignava]